MSERIGPRLRRIEARAEGLFDLEPSSVPGLFLVDGWETWVEVIAMVDGRPPAVLVVDTFLPDAGTEGSSIVTGRLRLRDVAELEAHDALRYADAPAPLREELDVSGPEVGAPRVHSDPVDPLTGEGVIVGIVDRGIDVDHPGFRTPSGDTRILQIWDQGISPGPGETHPSGYRYGTAWDGAAIDAGSCSHQPGSSHGIQVAGVVAGNGLTGRPPTLGPYVGIAPGADLVVVAIEGGVYLKNSNRLVDAASFIMDIAQERGCAAVVNISLGYQTGPHDGTDLVERCLANLIAPGRMIVKSVGNGGNDGSHAHGVLPAHNSIDLEFEVPRPAGGGVLQTIELWYSQGDSFDLEVIPPKGTSSTPIFPNTGPQVRPLSNGNSAFVISELGCICNSDNRINLDLIGTPSVPVEAGVWKVRITTGPVSGSGEFDAWIESAASPPKFLPPHRSDERTISSPCGVPDLIAVGSYAVSGSKPGALSSFSSQGPTRTGQATPDLVAPGESITSCGPANSGSGYVAAKGTSLAAPHVTGTVALMLQAEPTATVRQVIDCLVGNARSDGFTGLGPVAGWGAGKLDAAAAVNCVRPPGVDPEEEQQDEPVSGDRANEGCGICYDGDDVIVGGIRLHVNE